MAITRNPVTAYIRELDKDEPKIGKSKRATLKDITRNPVAPTTTVPIPSKSSRATLTDITGKALGVPSGTTVYGSGTGASTTGEEKLKLNKGVESVKRRLQTNLSLTPKQRQELIADAERIAAGQRREVSTGGSAPSLLKNCRMLLFLKCCPRLSPVISRLLRLVEIFRCSLKVRLLLGCLEAWLGDHFFRLPKK